MLSEHSKILALNTFDCIATLYWWFRSVVIGNYQDHLDTKKEYIAHLSGVKCFVVSKWLKTVLKNPWTRIRIRKDKDLQVATLVHAATWASWYFGLYNQPTLDFFPTRNQKIQSEKNRDSSRLKNLTRHCGRQTAPWYYGEISLLSEKSTIQNSATLESVFFHSVNAPLFGKEQVASITVLTWKGTL